VDPSDPFDIAAALTPDERARRARLRTFLDNEVRPKMAQAWEDAALPDGLLSAFAEVIVDVVPTTGAPRPLWYGVIKLELGRADPSLCSVFSVHYGLCRGAIARFGSPVQQARWLGPLARFEALGAFGLTEPDAGSAIASEMATRARHDGDSWVLDGEKRWIGNAPSADVIVVFARTDDGIGAFLVEKGAPGLRVDTMTGKLAKRAIQNGHVRLQGVRVPDAARLPGVRTFRDVATLLAHGRVSVAWEALGIATGAYEIAREYTLTRQQFGQPLAGFQLVQDRLVSMACTLTSMSCLLLQLARLEEADPHAVDAGRASIAKRTCAEGMRAVVADARALMGGEGLLLERHVARLFADAEAVYTYEGTHEINTLIVGRALTGIAAFSR
jgi:glutaryl-CoA dehydrogenase